MSDKENGNHSTVQFDPRFPNTNQTYNCFVNYVDYYRCVDLLRSGPGRCDPFKKVFETMCPNAWISHWDEMRGAGTFPRVIVRVPAQEKEEECCKKALKKCKS